MWQWLLHFIGADDVSGEWYGFWSGFGSIVVPPLLTAVPIVWVLLRKHNCEVHRCWRLGRHETDAGHHVCRKHHPGGHLTAADVIAAAAQARERWHLYFGKQPGKG